MVDELDYQEGEQKTSHQRYVGTISIFQRSTRRNEEHVESPQIIIILR
jgi:hypothetical protein